MVLASLTAMSRKPKLVIKEANKCTISAESLNSGGPTIALENGEGYTIESFDLCMKTAQGMECFDQGNKLQAGAKDNLKLLQKGQKFCIKDVVVKETATGKTRKLCRKSYKVV